MIEAADFTPTAALRIDKFSGVLTVANPERFLLTMTDSWGLRTQQDVRSVDPVIVELMLDAAQVRALVAQVQNVVTVAAAKLVEERARAATKYERDGVLQSNDLETTSVVLTALAGDLRSGMHMGGIGYGE